MRRLTGFFALLLLFSCTAPDADPGTIEGTVTNLSIGNGSVTGFDLVTGEETVAITVDPDRDYGFDLLHLEEHQSTGDPVIVETETEGDNVVALSIEDA